MAPAFLFNPLNLNALKSRLESANEKWKRLKHTSAFHDLVLFLVFVAISTFFWIILALNDNAQGSYNVKVAINNCPDSVTFISDIPEKLHVTVRDKGTSIWRNHYRHPTMNINFKEYADAGELRYSKNDIITSLKSIFGPSAQIVSISLDSLYLEYTSNKGKRVPVVVDADVSAASGSIIEGFTKASPSNVLVYGDQKVLDTIHKVRTERLILSDLSENTTVEVHLRKISDARILPSKVNVTVPVEPLVKKKASITITPVNVPHGESLLLFPSKVPVEYYVAMSRLNDDDDPEIELEVDFKAIPPSHNGKLHVRVARYPDRLKNLSLINDSVEFTIVKN